jgi:tetratricopeptide (TPR) repeat protein
VRKKKSRSWLATGAIRWLRTARYPWRFLMDWWSTRYWHLVAWSLPAIVAAMAVWYVGLIHAHMLPSELLRSYEQSGRTALDHGDLQAAEVSFRRMVFLDESSSAGLYGLALTAEQQGDLIRSRELFHRIAPEDGAGHPAAHFWLAQDLIHQKEPLNQTALKKLQHHLRQAMRSAEHRSEARVLLAQLHAVSSDSVRAIEALEQVVPERPELQLDLAQLYAVAGRHPESLRAAGEAGEFFQARAQAEPDQPLHRLRWASSLVLQARYEEAIGVLEQGLTLADPQPFHQALAQTYFRWMDAIEAESGPDSLQRLEILERVFQHEPHHERALAMIANLATEQDDLGVEARDTLRRMLAGKTTPAVVHRVVGTQAVSQGNFRSGLKHLEQARLQNPHCPKTMNNLAWSLAHQDQPDLKRALALAEAAQQMADHPEIHDTLGTILLKLGRPGDALVELETALRLLPGRSDLHRKLADVYQQLDNLDLAIEHQRLADLLEASTQDASKN